MVRVKEQRRHVRPGEPEEPDDHVLLGTEHPSSASPIIIRR
jgi:hypothetical protein